jgi:hypothetical protein
MEDLTKLVHELFPPEGAAVKKTTDATETPSSTFAGVDLAALAAGRAGLAQWPQSLLPTGGRA